MNGKLIRMPYVNDKYTTGGWAMLDNLFSHHLPKGQFAVPSISCGPITKKATSTDRPDPEKYPNETKFKKKGVSSSYL